MTRRPQPTHDWWIVLLSALEHAKRYQRGEAGEYARWAVNRLYGVGR